MGRQVRNRVGRGSVGTCGVGRAGVGQACVAWGHVGHVLCGWLGVAAAILGAASCHKLSLTQNIPRDILLLGTFCGSTLVICTSNTLSSYKQTLAETMFLAHNMAPGILSTIVTLL